MTDFSSARRRHFWRKLKRRFGHQCNELVRSEQVLQKGEARSRRDLGLQRVSLERIVGSSGRAHEFDLSFLPRTDHLRERWNRAARKVLHGSRSTPVLLFKVQNVYFVEDGNHRVSVARAEGQKEIEAHVIEVELANAEPNPSCSRLGFKIPSSDH